MLQGLCEIEQRANFLNMQILRNNTCVSVGSPWAVVYVHSKWKLSTSLEIGCNKNENDPPFP